MEPSTFPEPGVQGGRAVQGTGQEEAEEGSPPWKGLAATFSLTNSSSLWSSMSTCTWDPRVALCWCAGGVLVGCWWCAGVVVLSCIRELVGRVGLSHLSPLGLLDQLGGDGAPHHRLHELLAAHRGQVWRGVVWRCWCDH